MVVNIDRLKVKSYEQAIFHWLSMFSCSQCCLCLSYMFPYSFKWVVCGYLLSKYELYIYIDFQMENIQWSWTVLVGLTLSASHTWRSSFKKRNYNQDYIQRFIMLAWKYITLAWDYNILVLQKGFLSVFFNDGLLESLLSLTWHQKQCHFL